MSNRKRATKTRSSDGNYRLAVKDFGPIVEADVELRPLTVFIGPSNTGKSYLAILIYALHKCFAGDSIVPAVSTSFPYRRTWAVDALFALNENPNEAQKKDFSRWMLKPAADGRTAVVPQKWSSFCREILESCLRHPSRTSALANEIARCFGTEELGALVRNTGNKATAELSLPSAGKAGAVVYKSNFTRNGKVETNGKILRSTRLEISEKIRTHISDVFLMNTEDEDNNPGQVRMTINRTVAMLLEAIFESLVVPVSRHNAFYLPADRTGIMHSHQVVVSTLIQGATTAGLRPSQNISMLSGVLGDFLGQLIRMSQQAAHIRPASSTHLAKILEKKILQGAVRVATSETGYPEFLYRPQGWSSDVPLMRSSSMVSELAPVVLYLRHLVRPGDLLIIEEPESHLHPAMQARLATELVRLVNSGVRVLVTTHSEWLLDKFANLVRASRLNGQHDAVIPERDAVLDENDFGAWLFKAKTRPKGSTVEEITIDPEAGGLISDYEEVAEQLYNEWANIENELTVRDKK